MAYRSTRTIENHGLSSESAWVWLMVGCKRLPPLGSAFSTRTATAITATKTQTPRFGPQTRMWRRGENKVGRFALS